jgi:hypothetical protein
MDDRADQRGARRHRDRDDGQSHASHPEAQVLRVLRHPVGVADPPGGQADAEPVEDRSRHRKRFGKADQMMLIGAYSAQLACARIARVNALSPPSPSGTRTACRAPITRRARTRNRSAMSAA